MIAAWVVYGVLVAALLGLAALMGEAALRALGRQVRWVWAGAMLGSLVLPLAGWLGWSWRPWGAGSTPVADAEGVVAFGAAPFLVDLATPAAPLLSDRTLAMAWLVASGLAFLVVGSAVLRLARARSRWRPAVVAGVPVLVSAAVGPAALGVVRGAIVIPAWALALEGRLRRLMLLHEAEHLRVGDPRLLLAALMALAVMPWNPVLWWQFWRLRQALELDCDARVLCRAPDRRMYGLLLLEVSRRRCGGELTAAGLSRPRSFLERRIRMMSKRSLKGNRGRAIAASGIAVGLALLACEAERPTAPGVAEEAAPAATANRVPLTVDDLRREAALKAHEAASRAAAQSSFGGAGEGRPHAALFDHAPEIVNHAEVEAVLVRAYPPSLRDAGIGGTVHVWFSIDESGRVTQVELAKPSGFRALDDAAIQVAQAIKFAPADLDGQKVAVAIQLPITFRVS